MPNRLAEIKRKTGETEVLVKFDVDGKGTSKTSTGVCFLDHMLQLFAKHGLFELEVQAVGDTDVDFHHTVEDVGIVLGQVIKKALADKKSIRRYGTIFLPMDEAMAMVSVDLGGRPFIVFDVTQLNGKVGDFDTELVEEFFRAVAFNAEMNLHIRVMYGSNNHHMIEAIFKAFGRALDEATRLDDRIDGVMSTKGSI